jgi:hypothetical protein
MHPPAAHHCAAPLQLSVASDTRPAPILLRLSLKLANTDNLETKGAQSTTDPYRTS